MPTDTIRCFYCPSHIKRLHDGVDARGMGHLVWAHAGAKDERGLHWNPLDVADYAIIFALTRSRDAMPPHLRLPKSLGVVAFVPQEGCPLCEVDRHVRRGAGNAWADVVLDHCLEFARRRGLMDRPVNKVQFSLVNQGVRCG